MPTTWPVTTSQSSRISKRTHPSQWTTRLDFWVEQRSQQTMVRLLRSIQQMDFRSTLPLVSVELLVATKVTRSCWIMTQTCSAICQIPPAWPTRTRSPTALTIQTHQMVTPLGSTFSVRLMLVNILMVVRRPICLSRFFWRMKQAWVLITALFTTSVYLTLL